MTDDSFFIIGLPGEPKEIADRIIGRVRIWMAEQGFEPDWRETVNEQGERAILLAVLKPEDWGHNEVMQFVQQVGHFAFTIAQEYVD